MKKYYSPPTTTLIKTDCHLLLDVPISGTTTPGDSDAKPHFYEPYDEEDLWDSLWDFDEFSEYNKNTGL